MNPYALTAPDMEKRKRALFLLVSSTISVYIIALFSVPFHTIVYHLPYARICVYIKFYIADWHIKIVQNRILKPLTNGNPMILVKNSNGHVVRDDSGSVSEEIFQCDFAHDYVLSPRMPGRSGAALCQFEYRIDAITIIVKNIFNLDKIVQRFAHRSAVGSTFP